MDFVQINTVSTVDAVCQALEHDIFHLRYPPGTKITEADLTTRYGVRALTNCPDDVLEELGYWYIFEESNRLPCSS